MKISEYRQQKHPEHLIAYLEHIEWGAGKHLAERLRRGAFTATYGESAELHIAEADGKIIGFGAITEQDYRRARNSNRGYHSSTSTPRHGDSGCPEKSSSTWNNACANAVTTRCTSPHNTTASTKNTATPCKKPQTKASTTAITSTTKNCHNGGKTAARNRSNYNPLPRPTNRSLP